MGAFWSLWSARVMSTTYDYYYYDTYGTSTSYGDYYYYSSSSTEASVAGSECLNYIYLVWVYFLFYVGAGYPSSYYPYIIATLVDTVPQECGGTGGQTEGESLLTSSALNLLSLQQQAASPTFNGFIGGQVQYSSGEAIASQPVVGLDYAQLLGRKKRSESEGKRKKKLFQKMTKKNKQFMSSSKRKSSTVKKGKKQSTTKTSRKQTRIKGNKVSQKLSRENEKVSERQSARKSLRKGQRSKKRKSAKTSERKKQRKRKRKLSGGKESERKGRRKKQRVKLRRIEDSRLGKPIPKEKMEMFRENFRRGKEKVGGSKILKNVENPFEKRGRLRSDFRQLVRERVIQKLPDYCEQARTEKAEEKKADCARRAKRIRERIKQRKTS